MKRMLILIIALSVLLVSSVTASAANRHHDNDRHNHHNNDSRNHSWYSNHQTWRASYHNDYEAERHLPFKWHDRHSVIRERHHMERIYDGEWSNRFPGAFAYRWYGNGGFWHHGRYVTDAVLFFDGDDRLISIGYMHNGVFIHFRDDNEVYENHDSFFISWWRH